MGWVSRFNNGFLMEVQQWFSMEGGMRKLCTNNTRTLLYHNLHASSLRIGLIYLFFFSRYLERCFRGQHESEVVEDDFPQSCS